MRRRLVAAFVALLVGVILLYGLPRAYFVATRVSAEEQMMVDRAAVAAALLVEDAVAEGDPVTAALLEPLLTEDQRVEYLAPDGSSLVVPAGSAWTENDTTAVRTLPDGGRVTYSVSADQVSDRVVAALLPLLLLGLALIPVGALAGVVLARRLSQPFLSLAATAEQMGTGRLDLEVPHYDVPEAEAIGSALRDSARRLDLLVRREREVAVNASHELRTPITALRLALEDLRLWPQTTPEVAAEIDRLVAEVDRLSGAVTELLDGSREERRADESALDLAALVAEVVEARRAALAARDQILTPAPSGPVPAVLSRQTVVEALDRVLDGIADRGAPGSVGVRCADAGSHLAIRFRLPGGPNGGPTVEDLAVAAALTAAAGGRLAVENDGGTEIVLRFPRPDRRLATDSVRSIRG